MAGAARARLVVSYDVLDQVDGDAEIVETESELVVDVADKYAVAVIIVAVGKYFEFQEELQVGFDLLVFVTLAFVGKVTAAPELKQIVRPISVLPNHLYPEMYSDQILVVVVTQLLVAETESEVVETESGVVETESGVAETESEVEPVETVKLLAVDTVKLLAAETESEVASADTVKLLAVETEFVRVASAAVAVGK